MIQRFVGTLALVLMFFLWTPVETHGLDSATQKPQRKDASQGSGGDASTATGESSSKDTKIDLSPPPGEPGLNLNEGDTGNEPPHTWNPHKADKDVEIGYFYFKRKNYEAAISRYRAALRWQSNHALAMFRLGEALERTGQYADARRNYEGYLRILPAGEYARPARQALERLKNKPDAPRQTNTARGTQTGLPQ